MCDVGELQWGGAAGRSQAVQVSHDHHGRLPQVDGQVVVLRQRQVAQEALVGTHLHCEDLRITANKHKVHVSLNLKQEEDDRQVLLCVVDSGMNALLQRM